jgi:CHAT domain-containing protein/tetratricopeptide (TPR) repeat protein
MRFKRAIFAVVLAVFVAFLTVSLTELLSGAFRSQAIAKVPEVVKQPPAVIQANIQASQTLLCWAITEALSPVSSPDAGSTITLASSSRSIDCQAPVVANPSSDQAMLRYHEGSGYLRQGQYQQAIDLYQQAIDTKRQTVAGLNNSATSDSVDIENALYKLGFAYFKLAKFSEQLGYTTQQQQALIAAEAALSSVAVSMNLFTLTPSGIVSIRGDSDYLPQLRTFKLLQEVYVAQTKYDQALLIAEKGRTIAIDENIVNNVWAKDASGAYISGVPQARRFAIAEALAKLANLTIEDIKKIVRDEAATVISYSIISDQDDPRPFLTTDTISTSIDNLINFSERLLIWVIQPTGQITFKEQDLAQLLTADDLIPPDDGSCEGQGRGQSAEGVARVIGWTRGCILNIPDREVAVMTAASRPNLPDVSQRLQRLYQVLIPAEVEALLPQDPEAHVILVPQGSLFFVPFAALKDASGQYLVQRHTILTAPNLRALLLPQSRQGQTIPSQETSNRSGIAGDRVSNPVVPNPVISEATISRTIYPNTITGIVVPSSETVLIVGNPVMPTVQPIGSGADRGTSSVLPPLEKAGEEAQAIAALFQPPLPQSPLPQPPLPQPPLPQLPFAVESFINQAAPEDAVVKLMPDAKIIHFATHGILEATLGTPAPTQTQCSIRGNVVGTGGTSSEEVQNSLERLKNRLIAECEARIGRINAASVQTAAGAIALSPAVPNPTNPAGSSAANLPADEGLLTAREILKLDLKADLVVLSACNTGRGPLSTGGVIGLPFSFSLAGVPNIVASLWAVPDDSTAELMKDFYQQLLSSPIGLADQARALRQAMLHFLQAHPDTTPREWAAFTLMSRKSSI